MAPPPNNSPAVSVVVLNWNGGEYLPRCLEALATQTFKDFEVIVLDNASSDGSSDGLEARWPDFRAVRFTQNLEFSTANNRGAKLAIGKWLAFLNNDAFPEKEWLENLLKAAGEHPGFAFFASRLVYAGAPGRVQATGDIYHISGFAWPRDNNRPAGQAHNQPDEVFSASAAAALYDRQAFLAAGGFAEHFTSHYEDVDLGFRLRLLGYRCLYVPQAVVVHVGSASYGAESDRSVYQVQRNVIWCYLANMPGRLLWKYLPIHLFANLVFGMYYQGRGQGRVAWKAKLDALRALPVILQMRRQTQLLRKVEPGEIDRALNHPCLAPFLLGRRMRRLRRFLRHLPFQHSGVK
jgi:GT2 family glycosyltransferase